MILWWWAFRRLGLWVMGASVLTGLLLLSVEGLEQAGSGRAVWADLQVRIPLLLRDLLGLTLVFAGGGMMLRARQRDLPAFSLAGVSPTRLALVVGGILVLWSTVLGIALDGWIHQAPTQARTGWVTDGTDSVYIANGETPPATAWSLRFEGGEWRESQQNVDAGELSRLWSTRRPAEGSLAALRSSESQVSTAWWQWRVLNLVFPALLAAFAVWLALFTQLPSGWTIGLSLGLTLCTQVVGSMSAQAGQAPWLPVIVLVLAGALGILGLRTAQSAN
ncbi:MAG: hypothetical protein VXW32_04030 [Myxococcota bacterium]|nr:hypothetical protein [Myxococcota bacterium]